MIALFKVSHVQSDPLTHFLHKSCFVLIRHRNGWVRRHTPIYNSSPQETETEELSLSLRSIWDTWQGLS